VLVHIEVGLDVADALDGALDVLWCPAEAELEKENAHARRLAWFAAVVHDEWLTVEGRAGSQHPLDCCARPQVERDHRRPHIHLAHLTRSCSPDHLHESAAAVALAERLLSLERHEVPRVDRRLLLLWRLFFLVPRGRLRSAYGSCVWVIIVEQTYQVLVLDLNTRLCGSVVDADYGRAKDPLH